MEESNKEGERKMVLVEGKDFTTAGLKNYLNEKYGSKKTGKEFTIGDLQQYIIKGRLPKEYGGYSIKVRESDKISIKIISVDFSS